MIVGLRWNQGVLQFREEHGPWRSVPDFQPEPVEDTVAGDGTDPVHETLRELGGSS